MGEINAYGGYFVLRECDIEECDKTPRELLLGRTTGPIEIGLVKDDGEIEHKATLPPPKINEPVTFTADNVSINPDLWEKMLGPYCFARLAAGWAYGNRKDLFYRSRNNKRTRIQLKYYKYIIRAYREHLRGKKNAQNLKG